MLSLRFLWVVGPYFVVPAMLRLAFFTVGLPYDPGITFVFTFIAGFVGTVFALVSYLEGWENPKYDVIGWIRSLY